jgi:hypothetical protein
MDLVRLFIAGVAQLVEHHLAKVAVVSSNLIARSISQKWKFASQVGKSVSVFR